MILFLDNIRGFNKAFIDINQVNFLVGENSTGKTTVMSILNLLSDETFFRTNEFKNPFLDFGPFREIVNQDSHNQNSFAFGTISNQDERTIFIYDSFLMVFRENEGFPEITEFYLAKGNSVIIMEFAGEKFGYYFSEDILKKIKFEDFIFNWDDNRYKEEFTYKGILQESPARIMYGKTPLSLVSAIALINPIDLKIHEKTMRTFLSEKHFFRQILMDSIWIDPIRSKPRRVYEPNKKEYSAEGEHIPTVLRDIFANANSSESKRIIKAIHGFGKESGLFDEIIVDTYRKTIESPFELRFKLRGKGLKISNIGYGISQVLPILTEITRRDNDNESFFLIQQPEVHLHPKAQAFLGQFFFEQFEKHGKSFLIETHSDFIIDRFRLMVRNSKIKDIHEKVNILFFESTDEGNKVTNLKIDKNGDYPAEQPDKFRDFFFKEEMAMLGFGKTL